jgi:hypothetical protein
MHRVWIIVFAVWAISAFGQAPRAVTASYYAPAEEFDARAFQNVPPSNTLLVMNESIQANKDFDLILLPNRTYRFANESYTIRGRWVRGLPGAGPPHGYELQTPLSHPPFGL